ncbi:MAG: acyltransferase family protein [Leifsonia flava]
MSAPTTDHLPVSAAPARTAPGFLPEIQALRTVAVLLVVVYHLWPGYLPGGYIGVDVFFVISGYLITAHIVREVVDKRSFTLTGFYVRRIRRLLPAALVVLAVVGVATLLWAPQTLWNDTGKQIVASAFYVENWALVANSVDYLGASVESSPVQHFWSLSVEEQFYLFWPILIAAAWLLIARGRAASARTRLGLTLAGIAVASLVFSVIATYSDQPSAYFNTFTRVWEFAVGGVLAVFAARLSLRPWQSIAATWAGLVAILVSAVVYTSGSLFPGWIALLPVVGTAVVIAAGHADGRLSLSPVMRSRPVQFVGAISYSVYLWHWPLIVLLPIILERALDTPFRIALLFGSLLVGWLSKKYIEDPFRSGTIGWRSGTATPNPTVRPRLVFAMAAVGMVVVASIGAAQWAQSEARIAQSESALRAVTDPAALPCFGAAAAVPGSGCAPATTSEGVLPDPIIARDDGAADGCQQSTGSTEVLVCSFGSKAPGALRIAVAGDSHAGQWVGALKTLAIDSGWHLDTYLRSGCGLAKLPDSAVGGAQRCATWNDKALRAIVAEQYDAVIVSTRSSVVGGGAKSESQQAADASAMVGAWTEIQASGARVIAIHDIPQPANGGVYDAPTCVMENPDPAPCATSMSSSIVADPQVAAARELGSVEVIDLAPYFCVDDSCPAVLGSVLVYGDGNHMTALFAQTLTPYLGAELAPALGIEPAEASSLS